MTAVFRDLDWRCNMLRISTDITPEGTLIKVEGRLAGPLVLELERIWREVRADGSARPITVDVCGVTFIDARGKGALRMMCDEGVSFRSCGPDITATIDEIKHCSEAAAKYPHSAPV
jgi:anti-anti-sigma regulatory factor